MFPMSINSFPYDCHCGACMDLPKKHKISQCDVCCKDGIQSSTRVDVAKKRTQIDLITKLLDNPFNTKLYTLSIAGITIRSSILSYNYRAHAMDDYFSHFKEPRESEIITQDELTYLTSRCLGTVPSL